MSTYLANSPNLPFLKATSCIEITFIFMIIEILTLGGVLYAGYKSYTKQEQQINQCPSKKQHLVRKTLHQQKLQQMYQDVTANTKFGKKRTAIKHKQLSFDENNKREIVSGGIALGFATVAVIYAPLAYLSIPFLLYSFRLVIKEAWCLLRQGKIDIETLVTASVIGVILLKRFWIASFYVLLFRLSQRMTSKVIHDSRQHLVDIFQQAPSSVWLLIDGVEVNIPYEQVKKGDVVLVRAGDIVPVDGCIIDGMASIDQHILTGEAAPIEKTVGENVFSMTLVLSGKIQIQVEKAGADSTAAKITEILNHTADYKSGTVLRVESFSRQLINPVLFASAVALPVLGVNSALAVVLAHPKYGLFMIAPISILRHLKTASEHGVLIKDGRSLELLGKVDTIVFDKTGTLTEEQPHTGTIHCFNGYTANDVLYYAAAAEHKQTHPLARAILHKAAQSGLDIPEPEHCEYKLGYGLSIQMGQYQVRVGSERFMQSEGIALSSRLQTLQAQSHTEGYTLVMVALDDKLIGAIELLPTVRHEAKQVVHQLKQRANIKQTYIISGDNEIPTRCLAEELEIDHYFAQTLPENKAALIKKLQQEGKFICYIGDGINDSIALKQAQVSISLSGASQIATDTAQIILMDKGINRLPYLFDLADSLNNHMDKQFNIILGTGIFSVSSIFLLGFGVTQIFTIRLLGLGSSVIYSLFSKPQKFPMTLPNHN